MRNLAYLQKTIDYLVKQQKYLPAFIIKSQIIEYDLKRFLWQYCKLSDSYKNDFVTDEFLEKASLGNLYNKLSQLKDKFIDIESLVHMVKVFKKVRNEVIHKVIISEMAPEEIENLCLKHLDKADELLMATWGRLNAIEDLLKA